jgi:hypothetical protein
MTTESITGMDRMDNAMPSPVNHADTRAPGDRDLPAGPDDLDWFVQWRAWLWRPAVRNVVGDPARLRGRRVVELGFRTGRMSCYFAMHGASVESYDLPDCDPAPARKLARELGVEDRVRFTIYDGNLAALEAGQCDFLFTKSVLVLLPPEQAVPAFRRLLQPGGQYLGCCNLTLPFGLNRLRPHSVGVGPRTFDLLRQHFRSLTVKKNFGLVASIVATA